MSTYLLQQEIVNPNIEQIVINHLNYFTLDQGQQLIPHPHDLSENKPFYYNIEETTQNGLSHEFQEISNQQNGQNQPIPTPVIGQGGGGGSDGDIVPKPAIVQGGDINAQSPVDTDEPGAEFGLDVRRTNAPNSNSMNLKNEINF